MTDRSMPHRFTVAAAGMDSHYVNSKLIDGVPQELAPERLVYGPRQDSRLSLIAVEYIVRFTVVPATATPPDIHGLSFHQDFTRHPVRRRPMRNLPFMSLAIAGLALLAPPARAQSIVAPADPGDRMATAERLEQRAAELYAQPRRAEEAARLQQRSALLRDADDPRAIASLEMAARLLAYANRPTDARRIMEQAAERALAMGDVVRAADAYLDAAAIAQEQHSQAQVNRLGRKALLLASSPVLKPAERAGIVDRIRSSDYRAALAR